MASDGISWAEEAHHVFFRGKRNVFRKSKDSQYCESPDSIGLELSASWPSDLGAFVPTGRSVKVSQLCLSPPTDGRTPNTLKGDVCPLCPLQPDLWNGLA